MDLIVALVIAGAVLIFLDFFVPTFGLMSLVAAGMIVWGQVLAFRIGAATGAICLAATGALIAADVLSAYWLAKRTSVIHTARLHGDAALALMRDTLVGTVAVALTPLRPSGKVVIDGRQYDARCEATIVEAQTPVRILEVRGRELLVRPVERPHEGA